MPTLNRDTTLPTHRHHIHLICDAKDPSLYGLQDALTIFFEQRAFLTKDLFGTTSEAANYSWRCINNCDCVFVLLGESYGSLTNTGVSQLHISYLNAKTKRKPMAVFVLETSERPRQLSDLLAMIKEQVTQVHNITPSTDLALLFTDAYEIATIDKLAVSAPIVNKPKVSTISPRLKHKTPVNLADEVLLNCTAHAFTGGTLIEVAFMAKTKWQSILHALQQHGISFSIQGLWRVLNDTITPQAMPAVKHLYPDVHAISRCQVTKADVLWVEDELLNANFIAKHSLNSQGKPTFILSLIHI